MWVYKASCFLALLFRVSSSFCFTSSSSPAPQHASSPPHALQLATPRCAPRSRAALRPSRLLCQPPPWCPLLLTRITPPLPPAAQLGFFASVSGGSGLVVRAPTPPSRPTGLPTPHLPAAIPAPAASETRRKPPKPAAGQDSGRRGQLRPLERACGLPGAALRAAGLRRRAAGLRRLCFPPCGRARGSR